MDRQRRELVRHGRDRGRRFRLLGAGALALLLGVALGGLLLPSGDADHEVAEPVVESLPGPTPAAAPLASSERTPSGAARAAARALSGLADPSLLASPARRRAVVADLAVPGYRSELVPLFDRTYSYLADMLGPGEVVLRMTPVGYRVEAFSRQRATVAVWQVTLIGSTGREPIAAWATSRAELVWSRGGWRVERFGADTPGPTPAVTAPATPTASADFVTLARGLSPLAP